jgi:hypothetical protein
MDPLTGRYKRPCIRCSGDVEISGHNLGAWGAKVRLESLGILCVRCVEDLGLEVHREGNSPWLRYEGREFRFHDGTFMRSEHPMNRGIYTRDVIQPAARQNQPGSGTVDRWG